MRELFQQVREEVNVLRNELAEARLEIANLTFSIENLNSICIRFRALPFFSYLII